ncbi:hypothetical protein GCM10007147_42530 [Nocardiopsis kunsanensis]|uniref:Secreted protein n=1 Tax=Nocardiopsis kunsanensis TaxID=141693 RepID=A0A919CL96_9ACTN|nr:hypothetical protein [Nocardiopsis kunsanensis]GHD35768.1 hypothetical protein GCM10007147_42530 [Nocardiopsis kunsanensis]
MRKHRTWWVALLGAGALTVCGTAVPVSADGGGPAHPRAERGGSDHGLDGFTIGRLPEGLERHRVNASSSHEDEDVRRSEITWVQGADELAGRVAVLRSEALQELDDLRRDRFGHVRADALERLGRDEGFENGAYLSQNTGELFWVESPGVAVLAHLDPGRWTREELERTAGAIVPAAEESAPRPVRGTEEAAPPPVRDTGEPSPEEGSPDGNGGTSSEGASSEGGPEGLGPEEGPVLDVPTQHDPERPEAVADGAPEDMPAPARADRDPELRQQRNGQPLEELSPAEVTRLPEDTAFPDGIVFPDKSDRQGVPAFQQCLVNRFEEHGGLRPEQEGLSEETRAFVDRVQATGELAGGERNRLLATSWYHGSRDDKLRAAEECVSEQGSAAQDADRPFGTVSEVVVELDAQSRAAFDNVRAGGRTDAGATAAAEPVTAPVGPEEWERIQEHLPWHLPTVDT